MHLELVLNIKKERTIIITVTIITIIISLSLSLSLWQYWGLNLGPPVLFALAIFQVGVFLLPGEGLRLESSLLYLPHSYGYRHILPHLSLTLISFGWLKF
jgi:hypothetical protein